MKNIYIQRSNNKVRGNPWDQVLIYLFYKLSLTFQSLKLRGYSSLASMTLGYLLPTKSIVIEFEDNTNFSFPANDVYWITMINRSFEYEPEIYKVLQKIKDKKYTFLDCGANYGYWSCIVSGQSLGQQRVIAIEPSHSTFEILSKNCRLNKGRFITEKFAIYDKNDMEVILGGSSHSSASLFADIGERVTTISIDEILSKHQICGDLVIKLDVEGVEENALRGAASALIKKPLIFYEEHGKDLQCRASKYVFEIGFEVYDLYGDVPRRIYNIDSILKMKINPKKGYNFLALVPGNFKHWFGDNFSG